MPDSDSPVPTGWRRVLAWAKRHRKPLITWGQRILSALVIGLLVYQLLQVGVGEVLRALPTSPLFYVLIVMGYLLLPASEALIYRVLWGVPATRGVWLMLKKRVYNQHLVDYSGEAFLYAWARTATDREDKLLFQDVRDVNILSNVSSLLVALVLLGGMVLGGLVDLEALVGTAQAQTWIGVGLVVVLVVALVIAFRQFLFSMRAGLAWQVFGIHTTQRILLYTVRLWQWVVGVPAVTWGVWFPLLCASVVVDRLPLLPNKDLFFVGAGVEFAQALDTATAGIASMLLVAGVAGKVLNLLVYGLATLMERRYKTDAGVIDVDRDGLGPKEVAAEEPAAS
ncbi:MAG: hypothetical protein AAF089_08785 [Bacteroidota bacterium]